MLEKDIWIVAVLRVLFEAPFAKHLIFKGGTSLTKAWHAIRRFSEDVDVTFDIRAFAPDLVGGVGPEALPPTRSQEGKWTRVIRGRLAEWVKAKACPTVEQGLGRLGFAAGVRNDGDCLHVDYEPLFSGASFVKPEVKVEFGARATGEPNVVHQVVCDVAAQLPQLSFPDAHPRVMLAERTFWEKATATHVYCRQQRRRGERKSRHWHDLARLDEAGVAEKAMADSELALAVARHQAGFYRENDVEGNRIDFKAAVTGALQVVPQGRARSLLEEDYANMVSSGMLLGEDYSFGELMQRCAAIEARANDPYK